MTNAPSWSFCFVTYLLPLAFTCDSGKSKKVIAEDFSNVILPRMNNILENFSRQQANKTCKIRPTTPGHRRNEELQQIHKVLCRRLLNGAFGNLSSEIHKLSEEIKGTLGCQCSTKKNKHDKEKTRRRFCRVRRWLEEIKSHFQVLIFT